MKFLEIVSGYYRIRNRRGSLNSSFKITGEYSDIMLYDLRVTDTHYETPLGNAGNPYSRYSFPACVIYPGYREGPVLPKTPISILRNTITNSNYITNWRERPEDTRPFLCSTYGLILDANMVPIIEVTSKRNKKYDVVESIIIRINSSHINNTHPFFKYIYNTVVKQCIGAHIGLIPIDIHISENFKSPLYLPNSEFFETVRHEEEIANILSSKADDIVNYVMQ